MNLFGKPVWTGGKTGWDTKDRRKTDDSARLDERSTGFIRFIHEDEPDREDSPPGVIRQEDSVPAAAGSMKSPGHSADEKCRNKK